MPVKSEPATSRRIGGDGRHHSRRRRADLRGLPPTGRLRAASVHAADPARERAPARRAGRRRRDLRLAAAGRAVPGHLLPAGARPAPGLHRCAGNRRPGRDAERDAGSRRGSVADQPATPVRARDRPLRPGGRIRERWREGAFDNLKVVPPNTGIVHQVNLEFLARVVEARDGQAFPDTLLGTDSHTTMINGLGVLGWGVGGIEAEAAMLGEAVSMLVPQVVGFKLTGSLPEGATATDLVLTVTQILRQAGVVGKFVEYFGPGLPGLALADRATIGNMSPEYGATCGFFPVDDETLRYLRLTGRSEERLALVETYCKENALWHNAEHEPEYSQVVELDLGTVEPSLAGPRRPQDRVPLREAKSSFVQALETFGVDYGNARDEAVAESFPASDPPSTIEVDHGAKVETASGVALAVRPQSVTAELDGDEVELRHGSVVIAAITSCTNTSNPQVMVGAGLLAKNAVERGLERKPWVKSSLAPGSKVVTEYYEQAGLTRYLDELGFQTVGYGCTTCIGNSGPLREAISDAVSEGDLVVCSVLSGNRNFEARIHPEVKANYLASPPLVVAYSLAGRMDLDLVNEPIGVGSAGEDVYLADIWPSPEEIQRTIEGSI